MLSCTITVQKLRIPSLKGCRGKTLPQAKASPTGHFYHNKFEGTSQDDRLYKSRSVFVKKLVIFELARKQALLKLTGLRGEVKKELN